MLCIRLAATDLGTASETAFSKIPIHLAAGFAPIAPVWVGGEGPFDFLIDTGTDAVLIDPPLAKRFPTLPRSALSLDSMNGSARVPVLALPSLRIGSETIPQVEAIVDNLDALHRLSSHIRGVIGFRLLRRFSFEIDYARGLLSLWRPGMPPPPLAGAVVRAITENRIMLSSLSPEAPTGQWTLALDSGIAQPLIFSERLREAHYDRGAYLLSTNAAQTLARSLRLDELQVGGIRWRNVVAVTMNASVSPQNDLEDGLFPACAFAAVRYELTAGRAVLAPRVPGMVSPCSP